MMAKPIFKSIILSDPYLIGRYEPFVSKAAAMAYLILDQWFMQCTCMCDVVMCMLLHRDKNPEDNPFIEVPARISAFPTSGRKSFVEALAQSALFHQNKKKYGWLYLRYAHLHIL